MNIKKINEKSIVILGFGITGQEILRELVARGCSPMIVDDKITSLPTEFKNIRLKKTSSFLQKKYDVDLIFKSPGIKYSHPIIVEYKSAEVTNDIELAYLISMEMDMKIIGITGTNGKTSTTSFITHLLCEAGYLAKSCGNIGVSPLVALRGKKIDFLVIELSSFQLKSVEKFRCDFAFLLNISPDHLDFHITEEDYVLSKLKLVKNKPDFIYTGYDLNSYDKNVYFSKITKIYTECALCGVSRENLELVYEFSKNIGIKKSTFISATFTLEPIPHRVEFVTKKNGVYYYNDSKATNVEATKMALSSLNNIILLVGGFDKKEDMTTLSKYLKNVNHVVAYGDNKSSFSFIKDIKMCETLQEALRYAESIAKKENAIVLSPASASYDQFDNYEERGDLFKDLALGES